jgi:uncharacterized membrane protein (DUF2068 family)
VSRPTTLLLAAVLVAAEGLVVVALALLELIDLTPGRVAMGVTTTVFLGAYGLGLVACGWGLWQRSSWARSPAVLAQLIQLGLAWNFRAGETVPVAVALAVVAVVALVAIFAPPSLAALDQRDDE